MIFVSSACSKKKSIGDAVEELALNGLRHIELSGGTQYYAGYENDLIHLREKYSLQYLLHNYFPPPQNDFVINLASLDNDIYQRSLDHLKRAIELSQKLNLPKFGFHAGFFIDIAIKDIGKKIATENISNKDQSIERFCEGFNKLRSEAGDMELYIENNVYSATNFATFGNNSPLMLLCLEDFKELQGQIDFKLLLDVGHLFVSTHSLDLNFKTELKILTANSDYLHLSDNDGKHDLNMDINPNQKIYQQLRHLNLQHKTITLEIYQGLEATRQSLNTVEALTSP